MASQNHTIYDVAERAEVSISTVSRVLNTPTKVNPATRARVLAAIEELKFVPKAEASARARRSTGRIGVMAPLFRYPSFVQRLQGVAARLASAHYELIIYNVDTAEERDLYLTQLTTTRSLDGLIIMALPFSEKIAQRLIASHLEVVLVEVAHPAFSSIEIDDVEGGRLIAEYLVAQGHRRCGFIGDSDAPPFAINTSDHRFDGYRGYLESVGIELPEHCVAFAPHGLEGAYQKAMEMLAHPEAPSAIFAPSDTQAIGILRAARNRQLQVPSDIAVAGFDDIEIAGYIGLTTVHQPLEESGRVAVELLLARLEDRSRPPQRIHLPLRIVQRETA